MALKFFEKYCAYVISISSKGKYDCQKCFGDNNHFSQSDHQDFRILVGSKSLKIQLNTYSAFKIILKFKCLAVPASEPKLF